MKKSILQIFILSAFLVIFTGCIPGDGSSSASDPSGFFSGIWHGWIAPVSVIVGFFNRQIHIYEIYNTGWWYDFGFYMAVISGFGGLSFFRKKKFQGKHNN
ncbi:MAG: hypothetical protein JW982_09530 [Spirochaetes bacterium]|nr:hypothetical protein [Spirochaetota bacterium]